MGRIADQLKAIAELPSDVREEPEVKALLVELEQVITANPLEVFEPHSPQQEEFFAAHTPIVAAFAGNRFGKTTALVVRSILELVDESFVPAHLKGYKRWPGPTKGRIVCPDFTATAEGVILPAFREWAPKKALKGGSFDRAWDKQLRILRFANGSFLQVMTYEQDVDKFGGAGMHFIGYDEPPPKEIRDECMARVVDYGGYEMFTMTPLKANTGWIRRDVWKKRESPDITVVKGSIHDNPTLDAAAKERFLNGLSSDLWRRAREFGDFVDIGGLIYPDFEACCVEKPDGKWIREQSSVVSIDPGIRNAAFIWGAFDTDSSCFVYDELLLQDSTVADYAKAIRDTNEKWGIKNPLYVIDPAARSRAQVNAESVETELARHGIYCAHGQNQVEAGIQQVRTRLQHGRLRISRECLGLRDEADEYAAEDRPDGEFKPIKQNDHRLDALRYLVMSRPWDPGLEREAPVRRLGRDMTQAWPPPRFGQAPVPPTGALT